MVYGMPLLTVIAFYFMMKHAFTVDDDILIQTEALELKNEQTRTNMRHWLDKHSNYKRKVRKWD